MYSQSGQPVVPQPFFQRGDKSTEETTATSIMPQGANAASTSLRPRDGGLQKRVVATDHNAPKNTPVPPSPKLHGQKGPPILNANGPKSSSSVMKTFRRWVIRGGVIYLGYTAVFNCGPDASGIRGYYCKGTNTVGNLAKPYIAPHYNNYLGPHVDRYVKPVTRQSHRIYLKVADPVVQSAMSAAGNLYDSTAKKHVDSAKEQVFSILPYPFKSKKPVLEDSEQSSDGQHDELGSETPEVEKISRQPVHAHESEETFEKILENFKRAAEDLKDDSAQNDEKVADATQEDNADVKESASSVEVTEDQTKEASDPLPEPHAQEEHEASNVGDAAPEGTAEGESAHETKQDEQNVDPDHDTQDEFRERDSEDGSKVDNDSEEKNNLADESAPKHGALESESSEETVEASREQDPTTQPEEANEPQTESSPPTEGATPEFSDTPTGVPEESEQSSIPTEPTSESVEQAISEDTPAPTEEELRNELPVATDSSHAEERPADVSVDTETKDDNITTGHEDRQEQEEFLSDDVQEGDTTPEQQAASDPEHDEL
ncbi:hypothetical protein BGX31_006489 [Mortierella sp. GBA43]|nr:hypothetical protein BGX31_006489 [Mortierella sp. GBA43]